MASVEIELFESKVKKLEARVERLESALTSTQATVTGIETWKTGMDTQAETRILGYEPFIKEAMDRDGTNGTT